MKNKENNEQEIIWKEIWSNEYENIFNIVDSPKEHDIDLKLIIDEFKGEEKKIIEIGCGTGMTSLIIDDSFKKTLLDVNPEAIKIAKEIFSIKNIKANFIIGNMFEMEIKDKKFDIVFNSGVIEHFSKKDRIKALAEYKRILKDDGIIILAFPNHYSIPYRFAYLLAIFLNKWPFPKEYKIYDLSVELAENDLLIEKRIVTSKKSSFEFLKYHFIKKIFLYLNNVFKFEGYLIVLIIKKN